MMTKEVFFKEWLKIVCPFDASKPGWTEKHKYTHWIKYQIAHFANSKIIVEIGVKGGYSAWAMLKATHARFFGYDNYVMGYAVSNPKFPDGEEFEKWARKILSQFRYTYLYVEDSQVSGFTVPRAELYHVDGDHHSGSAQKDIETCIESSNTQNSIIVVHDYDSKHVRRAVSRVLEKYRNWSMVELKEPINGDAILFQGETPDWIDKIDVGKEM